MLAVLPASLLAALGMALSYIPATIAAMSGAQPEEAGLASGLISTSYQVGSALGLAAMVAVSTAATAVSLHAGISQRMALTDGFHAAFLGATVIALVGALLALVWLRQPKTTVAREEMVTDLAAVE